MSTGIMTQDWPCGLGAACAHGGTVKMGDMGSWVPRGDHPKYPDGSAMRYHVACFAQYMASRADGSPAPTPAPPPMPSPSPAPPPAPAAAEGELTRIIQSIAGARGGMDEDRARAIAREEFDAALQAKIASGELGGVVRYEVRRRDGVTVDCGTQHKFFTRVLDLITLQRHLWIHGPAGTGKSQCAINAAEALGLPVYVLSLGPQSPASRIEGFVDAQGRFVEPEWFKAYTKGGVFLFDEADNMPASMATTLNTALANKKAAFPGVGTVDQHPDLIVIFCANTSGRGPTPQHPERRKQDGATIDRARFLYFPPDEELERALAIAHGGGKDAAALAWCQWVQSIRAYISRPDCGIQDTIYCGMRSIIGGAQLIANPPAWEDIAGLAEAEIFKGLSQDKVSRILAAVPLPQGVL